MTNSEMLQAAFAALESGDSQLAGEYLADDFVFRGTLPQPLDKKRYLGHPGDR
jgi:ketosteroid isomerase-like protein